MINESSPTIRRTFANRLMTGFNIRRDGKLLRNIDSMRQIMPYLFKTRNGSVVYSPETVEFDRALEYVKEKNRENPLLHLGTFEIVIAAVIRTLSQYPYLNRFIAGKKAYARKSVSLSFVVLRLEDGEYRENTAKIYFNLDDTLSIIADKVNAMINLCKSGEMKSDDKLVEFVTCLPSPIITLIAFVLRKLNDWGLLPMSMIQTDPLYSTAFIANLGSIGHKALHHHLYDWGTTSMFLTIGKLSKTNIITKEGLKETKNALDLVVTLDERIADGIYLVKALEYFKTLVKHPERLESPPEMIVEDDGI